MIRRSLKQRGFTLIELMVGIGIMSLVVGGIGSTVFYSVGTGRNVVKDGQAINELRKGFSWFSSDAKMAKTTSLIDGAGAVTSATFDWTDEYEDAGTPHTISYALTGSRLVRTMDGVGYPVASNVTSVEFTRSGQVVTVQATVNTGSGVATTLSVSSLMRVNQ